MQYAYTVRDNGHNAVTTKTLDANDAYRTSVTIYDGLLRQRQTQADGANRDVGGRVVTDTLYDSRGLVAYDVAAWATAGAPATVAVTPTRGVARRRCGSIWVRRRQGRTRTRRTPMTRRVTWRR